MSLDTNSAGQVWNSTTSTWDAMPPLQQRLRAKAPKLKVNSGEGRRMSFKEAKNKLNLDKK